MRETEKHLGTVAKLANPAVKVRPWQPPCTVCGNLGEPLSTERAAIMEAAHHTKQHEAPFARLWTPLLRIAVTGRKHSSDVGRFCGCASHLRVLREDADEHARHPPR